jgi:hypothetical protein
LSEARSLERIAGKGLKKKEDVNVWITFNGYIAYLIKKT